MVKIQYWILDRGFNFVMLIRLFVEIIHFYVEF